MTTATNKPVVPAETVDACPVCGWRGSWHNAALSNREAQSCKGCGATLKLRNLGASVTTHLGRGRYANLRDVSRDLSIADASSIYEMAPSSPFTRYFNAFKTYVRTQHWDETSVPEGVLISDPDSLVFRDKSFDMVVSSDVFEHILDYKGALREAHRVLKDGGWLIFTVPMTWPIPDTTLDRAEVVDGAIVHRAEPRFHRNPIGIPELVCTDFGFDLLQILESFGFQAWFERPSIMRHPGYFDPVVVAQKPRNFAA